jgi:hypothetical protein
MSNKHRRSSRQNRSTISAVLSALRQRGFLLMRTPRTYEFDASYFFREKDHPKMVARAHKNASQCWLYRTLLCACAMSSLVASYWGASGSLNATLAVIWLVTLALLIAAHRYKRSLIREYLERQA